MNWVKRLTIGIFLSLLGACDNPVGQFNRVLPFPTPAQHDLRVLAVPGMLTYMTDENGKASGVEHDLVEAFARDLGVEMKIALASADEIEARMNAGEAHIAIGWLGTPGTDHKTTPPILQSGDVLLQHEASLPISSLDDLRGRTVHALAGSRQLSHLRELQKLIPELTVREESSLDFFELIEAVGERRLEFAVIDSTLIDFAIQLVPNLQAGLSLGNEAPVVWWLGPRPNPELAARINVFAEKVQRDGTLASIEDRYFGHVKRLRQADITRFLADVEAILPKYRKFFQAAELDSGLDWRLIAALAYQESKWDPNATSYTNVRGIMMLTEDTADRLRVSNRLDPLEAVFAGARYLVTLKEQLGPEAREPDRTWLALAAYNIGPGAFATSQRLAKALKVDAGNWYEMKRVLPLLAKPKYQQMMKSGRIRGGEAVIMAENIRSYYSILQRNAPTFSPTPTAMSGLKRIVAEAEQMRKRYVRKAPAQPTMVAMGELSEPGPARLPKIETQGSNSSSEE